MRSGGGLIVPGFVKALNTLQKILTPIQFLIIYPKKLPSN
jgi:hypothetical protein